MKIQINTDKADWENGYMVTKNGRVIFKATSISDCINFINGGV